MLLYIFRPTKQLEFRSLVIFHLYRMRFLIAPNRNFSLALELDLSNVILECHKSSESRLCCCIMFIVFMQPSVMKDLID